MIRKIKNFSLIHFGHSRYDEKRFEPVSDHNFVKPSGGLWASPIDCEYGWKEWCEENNYCDCDLSKSFVVNFTGRTLIINGLKDLKQLPWIDTRGLCFPLFQPLVHCGIDAVYLTAKGQWETRFTHPKNLYGWDCACVLLISKQCVSAVTSTGSLKRR